jgi:tetratricopeptide (TPR) repeat protein
VAEFHVGDALKIHGHPVEALRWYYRALEINPNDGNSYTAIAFYEHENGINLPDVIEHYKKALDRVGDESRAQLLTNMGYAYDKLGDPERAKESFEAAAKLRRRLE